MLCPFCLAQPAEFSRVPSSGYACPECKEAVPAIYVDRYTTFPPVILTSVGFRGHGKTVYLASLFHILAHHDLPSYWPGFYKSAIDDRSLETVDANVGMLKDGVLPDSTAKNFPRPTLIELRRFWGQHDVTLLCYDAAGESFEKTASMVSYASFFTRSSTVLFLISVPDLERENVEVAGAMEKLLTVYRNGLAELGGNTRSQRLVVVYTKADEWAQSFPSEYEGLRRDIRAGTFDGLRDYSEYKKGLSAVSAQLRDLTRNHLKARTFLNNADDNFASVVFCIVSALGASPEGRQLPTQIAPRRVLDPLTWVVGTDPSASRSRSSHTRPVLALAFGVLLTLALALVLAYPRSNGQHDQRHIVPGPPPEDQRLQTGPPPPQENQPTDFADWHQRQMQKEVQIELEDIKKKRLGQDEVAREELRPLPGPVGPPGVRIGDTYVIKSVHPDQPELSTTTERKVIFLDDGMITVTSKNLERKSAKVRTIEFTPEWNLIGSRTSGGSGFDYSPPLKYFEFPLYPGKTWQQTSRETNIETGAIRQHAISATVGDWSSISAPAGTFRAIKITIRTELLDPSTGQKSTSTDTSWYSPEARRSVKSEVVSRNFEGREERQSIQLMQYQLQ